MADTFKDNFSKYIDESFRKRKSIEIGTGYTAVITSVKDDYVFIKVKSDTLSGIIPAEEFSILGTPAKPGQEIGVFFLKEESGDFYFTTALQNEYLDWSFFEIALEKEIPVIGQIRSEVNGGYDIKLGEYGAFCPHSQLDMEVKNHPKLLGSIHRFMFSEVQQKPPKLVVSQKQISDKQRQLKREILKDKLEVGSFVSCTIKSIHSFGLIVDVNGLDALVPVSEATYKRNPDLNLEFQVGQTLRGKVLSLDWDTNKISLTIKDSIANPWSSSVTFKEGDIVSGEIDSLKPFGLFVKLTDVFSALVPNRETGFPSREPLSNHYKKGDKVEIFIMEVNPEKKQISASIVKAKETKEKLEYQSYLGNQSGASNTSSFGNLLKKSLQK
jgi:ribosomal protein S1